MFEPDITAGAATNADAVSFLNHDKAGGKVQSITEGKLNLLVGGSLLHVPAGRVRRIDFGAVQRRDRTAWPVGSSRGLSRRRLGLLPIGINGMTSPCPAAAPFSAPWPFNPHPSAKSSSTSIGPKKNPAPTLENEFEALDQ